MESTLSSNRLYRYIHTYNVNSKVTLNNSFGNRTRDCSNNTRSLNSNNSTPFLIYHQNIRWLQNKTDELSMLRSTNFPHVLCFTEHHLHNDELNCIYIYILIPTTLGQNTGGLPINMVESAYSFLKPYILQTLTWVNSVTTKILKFVQ